MPDPVLPQVPTSQPAAPASAVAPPDTGATDKPAGAADSGAAPDVLPPAKEVAEFARHRKGLRAKAQRLTQMEAQLKEREKAIAERDAARDKEIAELRARAEKWEKGNPLEHVEDPSKTVRDFVEKTAPERRIDQLEKERKELLDRLAKLEKLPEELKKQQEQERAQLQQQRTAAALVEQRKTFTRLVRERAADFPYLDAEHEDVEIEAFAAEIQQWADNHEWLDESGQRRKGKAVSFDEAAKWLNDRAKRVYEIKAEKRSKLSAPPESQALGSGTGRRDQKPPPGNGRRDERPAPAAPPRRPGGKLTRAEEVERDLQMLRDAQAKDRADAEKQQRLNGTRR